MATVLPAAAPRTAARDVPARAIWASLLLLLAVPQVLLWRFLGFSLPWLLLGTGLLAIVGTCITRALAPVAIPARRVALLGALALGLCLLGGEGRFFYANPDWSVRDAVLRDFVVNPWPFAYAIADPLMLRLPAAMYLLPAAIGKAGGLHAAELALLAQNTVILGALLTLGSTLFATARARAIALAVMVGFSGMDLLGAVLAHRPLGGHLEWWGPSQFSSHLTQLFWVPQHAFAGWAVALLFLLWRAGRLELPGFLAAVPLLGLWSPFALFGALPFAALAGGEALWRRTLTLRGVALPALALAVAVPGLVYMVSGSGAVGLRFYPIAFGPWALFEAVEVLPLLLVLRCTLRGARVGAGTLAAVAASLFVAPLFQTGNSIDFAMRASIPALAIVAVLLADLFAGAEPATRRWRAVAALALAIGLATPFAELRRAVLLPPSPAPLCSYLGVVPGGAPTYTAPLASLPPAIRPATPALIAPHDPARCWAGDWPFD